ncbi:unnamed protein product [Rotaria sp. Silwood2]|nr:unnamed protein product [Rotaria sp. Silwood2]CAF2760728.1 unnamed protein product [Rotaria sp. Silwood2]CAF3167684.1 unnamed protein product [Rotaria sp. Silwood2]CAF3991188.1 unnamed protein product [Rotaria sp. Silwood2]CAF4090383.1 unnamed protein product [Rotaria sp. Silwood2]
MSDEHQQSDENRSEDSNQPSVNADPVERGRQMGLENAHGGHSVGTGGHGLTTHTGSGQPLGGKTLTDISHFSQKDLHPGLDPDPVERGRQLGHNNAQGGRCVGTGGHGANAAKSSK